MPEPATPERTLDPDQTAALAPLAALIADTVRSTPIHLGPGGTDRLTAELTVRASAWIGRNVLPRTPGLAALAVDIDQERQRQIAKYGEQRHQDGTGNVEDQKSAESARAWCHAAFGSGYGTWADVLAKVVAQVNAERDRARLRAALVQVAAVCAAWVADIDSRKPR
ncbi:NUDIX hydrolase [Streptomyces sp. NPDC047315]|uniref:NUDIX hydrolase n=1 Tax=Streptomyces sp. NPDC047315 TaxID=3155142 RepID=UPI0033C03687